MPSEGGGRWADLGSGGGNFTLALASLLGPSASITAVDRDPWALRRLASRLPSARALEADFRKPLGIGPLEGVLMANSLHFVRDKAPVLELACELLVPGGRLVVVEYGTDHGNLWVPHPFSYRSWERLAAAAGLVGTRKAGELPSRHLGSMYCAVSLREGSPPRS